MGCRCATAINVRVSRDMASSWPTRGAGARVKNGRMTDAALGLTPFDPAKLLPDDMLERFRERAAVHDRENTFPEEDLAELKAAGYLAILVPKELGGSGLGLT